MVRSYSIRFLTLISCLLQWTQGGEADYSAEPYLIGYGVSANGLAGVLPSLNAPPTDFITFPSHPGEGSAMEMEIATLPHFGGLAEIISGAARFSLDSNTQIGFFGAMVTNDDIQRLPGLTGTRNQRLADPTLRPTVCDNCPKMKNVDYPAMLHMKRGFSFGFPRSDHFSRFIPLVLTLGVNIKYLKSELEGDEDEYIAQNLNLDGGVSLKLYWNYDGTQGKSTRNFGLDLIGYELLQTKSVSPVAEEKIESRYGILAYWEENVPIWNTRLKLGLQQQTGWEKYPGVALEWEYFKTLSLRVGWRDHLAAGAGFRYRFLHIYYSFVQHELNSSPYQFSLHLKFNWGKP